MCAEKKRGWNLSKGQPDGDRGRSLGGKARTSGHALEPIDDSGRSHAQYWAQVGWCGMVARLGLDGAKAHMRDLGVLSFARERREYSRYLGHMREMAE